jgi:hypothetical protein
MTYETTLASVRALSEHRIRFVPRKARTVKPEPVRLPREFIQSLMTSTPTEPPSVKHRSNFQDWWSKT